MATFLIDDFNDNSIDASKWDTFGGVTESSSRLNIARVASGGADGAYCKRYFNLREGILAAKLVAKSGTTHASVSIGLGVSDLSGNFWQINGPTANANFNRTQGGVAAGATTVVDTTVGFGPSLSLGSWLGYTYNTGDNTIRLLKSSDGVNWSQLHRCIITGGSMNWGDANIYMEMLNQAGGSSNFVCSWDDPTYFATDTFLKSRVRVGGAWVMALPKVRVGGAWIPARSKNRVGGAWVDPN